MSLSVNQVTLVGHLGADPVFVSVQERKGATLSLATTTSFLNKLTNSWEQVTKWHNIFVLNDHLVEYIQKYLKKGSHVYVQGELDYKKYTDKNGIERKSTSIFVGAFNGSVKAVKIDKDHDNSSPGNQSAPHSDVSSPPYYTDPSIALKDDPLPF
jgi:single-strand DNA-binding protein